MSRSRRKTPVIRHGGSDKQWRQKYNRKLRRANKVRLQKQQEDFMPKLVREVSNVYDSCRDCTFHFWNYKHGGHWYLGWVHKHWYWNQALGRDLDKTLEDLIEEAIEETKEDYQKWMRK